MRLNNIFVCKYWHYSFLIVYQFDCGVIFCRSIWWYFNSNMVVNIITNSFSFKDSVISFWKSGFGSHTSLIPSQMTLSELFLPLTSWPNSPLRYNSMIILGRLSYVSTLWEAAEILIKKANNLWINNRAAQRIPELWIAAIKISACTLVTVHPGTVTIQLH